MYVVEISDEIRRDFKSIPIQWQKRLWKVLKNLENNPYHGKKLKGDFKGEYSIRIWPYRVIYRIHKQSKSVHILKIGHRQGIYG